MGCRETQLSRALYGGDGGLGPVCSVSLNEPAPGHCQKCDLLGAVSVMRKLFLNMFPDTLVYVFLSDTQEVAICPPHHCGSCRDGSSDLSFFLQCSSFCIFVIIFL